MTLADELYTVLSEGPLPCETLARHVCRRTEAVRDVLKSDDRFCFHGSTRGRKWFRCDAPPRPWDGMYDDDEPGAADRHADELYAAEIARTGSTAAGRRPA